MYVFENFMFQRKGNFATCNPFKMLEIFFVTCSLSLIYPKYYFFRFSEFFERQECASQFFAYVAKFLLLCDDALQ